MTTHLTAISGKDGEVLLKSENPYNMYEGNLNPKWKDFNDAHPPYPIHGLTLLPGERVEADSVELVWQYRHTPTSNWLTSTLKDDFPNISFEQYKEDNEVVSGFETRQVFIPVTPKPPQQKMNSTELIQQERDRQISKEGWTEEHDDEHVNGELAKAADCYYEYADDNDYSDKKVHLYWPFEKSAWKPKNQLSDYIRAGALYKAELQRLMRMGGAVGQQLTNLRIGIRQCEIKIDDILEQQKDVALLDKEQGEGEKRYEILEPCYQVDEQIELLKKDFENNDRPLFNNPMYLAGVHDGMYHLRAHIIEISISDFCITMTDVERAFCFGYITNPTNNCLDNVEMMRRWQAFKTEYIDPKILE